MKKLSIFAALAAVTFAHAIARADEGVAVTPLHQAGERLILDVVCAGSEECEARRGPQLREAARTVVDTCLSEPGVPRYVCLGLVANISNEGGGLEHPTCGGLDQACVQGCDALESSGARQDCFVQCALDQGLSRGSARFDRVKRCNDRGTSRGPYQMKPTRVKQCRKLVGPDFDPFSLAQSTLCTARLVKRTATAKIWPCGKSDNRWLVAMKRVGRGTIRVLTEAQPGRWVATPRGEKRWVPEQEAVVEPVCDESGYGQRGLRYYQDCPDCKGVRSADSGR